LDVCVLGVARSPWLIARRCVTGTALHPNFSRPVYRGDDCPPVFSIANFAFSNDLRKNLTIFKFRNPGGPEMLP
jgi:hypothetical protein